MKTDHGLADKIQPESCINWDQVLLNQLNTSRRKMIIFLTVIFLSIVLTGIGFYFLFPLDKQTDYILLLDEAGGNHKIVPKSLLNYETENKGIPLKMKQDPDEFKARE